MVEHDFPRFGFSMRFTKMHGAGNDYVYVDCFAQPVPSHIPQLARQISDRRKGVGGDGLILICPTDEADAEMRMYNADGSMSEMCGNGIRCVAKYVYDHGICRNEVLRIASGGKVLSLELTVTGGLVSEVRVDMGEPILLPAALPTTLRSPKGETEPIVEFPFAVGGHDFRVTCVSMGNPHCVIFVDEPTDELVLGIGPQIERDPRFPKRVNVEFVKVLGRGELVQRTWERGSGETYACGTGASAVCVAGVLSGRSERNVAIHLIGGDLSIEWNEENNHVFMTGPATEVFSGDWHPPID